MSGRIYYMKSRLIRLLVIVATFWSFSSTAMAAEAQRWSVEQANQWYARQPWLVGSNYIPANAINQLEMWQAETFDPNRIELELGWAEKLGMNTMRVFLHDLLWQQDSEGFKGRIDTFLSIAARHGIRPMFVLLDSCWDPRPHLGPQHPPIPGVHNSGWVQSPSGSDLQDPSTYPRLRKYIEGVVGAFANDTRILAWDIWNEPDHHGQSYYADGEAKDKSAHVAQLMPQVFAWARAQHPIQPLTSGLWSDDDWSPTAPLNPVERIQVSESDFLSFHDYYWPEHLEGRIEQLRKYGRPMICTEYMARSAGSTIDGSLPVGQRAHVGMLNWGFVLGKTQTNFPWNSWRRPYTIEQPTVWFHDLLKPDGTPYREREVELLRSLSTAARRNAPPSAP